MSTIEMVLAGSLIWLSIYIIINRICICVEHCCISKNYHKFTAEKKEAETK